MYNEVKYDKYLNEVYKSMRHGGLFLTTGDNPYNVMVIGWGGITIFWGKPVFLVPVRKSRYTYEILEQHGEFTVNIPIDNNLSDKLIYCGTNSGRDGNKFEACGLNTKESKQVSPPIIEDCSLFYECSVIYKQDMDPVYLDNTIKDKWYPDYHTMYYGTILSCYKK